MKLVAANRLIDGVAVWLGPDGGWVEDISEAEIARDKETQERLERTGREAFVRNEVLDVELIDVEIVDGTVRPLRLRERIRAAGPSIHPELGKQAKKPAVSLV
ncbi:DUF2849 domain-containing protein [Chelativorans sp. AA-79]|uniref:DUF2849 domain-containing protein n=1 Tax=Chelativorans sp. AA-79 TaxID=3028735 RepID=UPI0023F808BC|nr:DUF2849 domain-containing protein [Chelativorans sp. AA-79]WEX09327.1 DUF2849 domain-containing protein [Chelativorans sp. AA-79]